MKRLIVALVPIVLLLTAAVPTTRAQQANPLNVAPSTSLGAILTDASGRTVYLFTKDTQPNQSVCTDQCATNWPPVTPADASALPDGVPGALSTFDRSDGTQQVAYNGIPLYYFAKDAKAGDINGQGVGGIWFVVSPGAAFGPYAPAPGEGTPVPAATLLVGFTAEYGPFLTDAEGMTLYTFNKDKPGTSTCTGDCATEWPPITATSPLTLPVGIPGETGTIMRDDGTMQATYDHKPLYTFDEDKQPSDVTGNNKDDFVVASVGGGAAASTPEASSTKESSGSTASGGSAIQIANFAFAPTSLTVSAGTTVTWTNADSTAHTVTADDGSFDSGNLDPGKTFSFTFKTPGTYAYHCAIHPNMKATIVVK
jgi:predicted lipoprotein with Yx(FWY)xxD motif